MTGKLEAGRAAYQSRRPAGGEQPDHATDKRAALDRGRQRYQQQHPAPAPADPTELDET